MTIDEKKLNVTTHSSGWSINICNDTVLKCRKQSSNNENDTGLYYNSSAIYRDEDGYCFRVAGSFSKIIKIIALYIRQIMYWNIEHSMVIYAQGIFHIK